MISLAVPDLCSGLSLLRCREGSPEADTGLCSQFEARGEPPHLSRAGDAAERGRPRRCKGHGLRWFSRAPEQHLTDSRHCRCNGFSSRNVPSCDGNSWKHSFKSRWGLQCRELGTGSLNSLSQHTGEPERCEQQGVGVDLWISEHRLSKGPHPSRTLTILFNSSSK